MSSCVVKAGMCEELLPEIQPGTVDLVVTSPPYADQRKDQYGGVAESAFPTWCVQWMEALRPTLKTEASVFINIRPSIKNGQVSDYTLRTRLELREAGWVECEELIWVKTDAPPLGSLRRPRRSWESVHWFSLTGSPWVDLKANGRTTNNLTLKGGRGQLAGFINGEAKGITSGIGRQTDVLVSASGAGIDRSSWNDHPAQYPLALPMWLIQLGCPPGGTVLDPFVGSGTTGVAAKLLGRNFLGFDRDPHYVEIAERRIQETEEPWRLELEDLL